MDNSMLGPAIYQLKSKPASALIAYNSFVAICSLLYQKQNLIKATDCSTKFNTEPTTLCLIYRYLRSCFGSHFSPLLRTHLIQSISTHLSCGKNSETNLLYGGSFKRFMHVADVGNRSRASSEALPAALYEQSTNKFHKAE